MDLELDVDALRRRADPETDRLVGELAQCLASPGDLTLMTQRIFRWQPGCAPPAGAGSPEFWKRVGEYLQRPFALQGWEEQRIVRAQESYGDFSNVARAILGLYSLPALYVHPEISLTLMGTGRLLQHTRMRLEETQRFVDEVTRPGSLCCGATPSAWIWIRKVRLMHAIRRYIAKLTCPIAHDPLEVLHRHIPDWSSERDDEPVDQIEVAYVMLTFSWVVVDGLRKLRVPMSEQQSRDHIYLWAMVAHMLGVVDELLPRQPGEELEFAQALFERVRGGCLAAGDDRLAVGHELWKEPRAAHVQRAGLEAGRQLMAVLLVVALDVQRATFPERWRWVQRQRWIDDALMDLPRFLVRRLAGVPTARLLYVGRVPFLHWLICKLALWLVDLRSWSTRTESPLKMPPFRSAAA